MQKHTIIRFFTLLLVFSVLGAGVALGQTTADYKDFEKSFENFATDVASSLPLNSTIGNNTPDAYIGQLLSVPPHFSVGVTTGASTIPYKTVADAMDKLNLDKGQVNQFSGIGVPLPAYTVDVRLGGFVLPFDVGLKLGGVPRTNFGVMPADLQYLLVGGDIRYAVIEQNAVLPNVSVGAGYNYLSGQIYVPNVVKSDYEVTIPDTSPQQSLRLSDPDLRFFWQSSVVDLKAQVSKQFVVVTPYAGLGTSFGWSQAGGGLSSKLEYDPEGDGTYRNVKSGEISDIEKLFKQAGFDAPDLDKDQGISVGSSVNGWAFRAFGGVGFNILAFKLDVGLGYDLLGRNVMASLSGRFQL